MTTVPFLAAFFGVLLSGWLADKLVKKRLLAGRGAQNADHLWTVDLHLHHGGKLHQRPHLDHGADGAGVLR